MFVTSNHANNDNNNNDNYNSNNNNNNVTEAALTVIHILRSCYKKLKKILRLANECWMSFFYNKIFGAPKTTAVLNIL